MLEEAYTSRDGKQSGTVKQAESYKDLTDEVGKEQALSYANRGWKISQQSMIRLEGVEGKRAKLAKILALAKTDDSVKEALSNAGINVDEL